MLLHPLTRKAFRVRTYLLISAAWLFLVSFLFSSFFSYQTSIKRATTQVEELLHHNQEDYHQLIQDTALLYRLYNGNYPVDEAKKLYEKPFCFFIYTRNDIGNPLLSFWNTHQVEPLPGDLSGKDNSHLVTYNNGYLVLEKHTVTVRKKQLMVIALFPVKWKYFVENKYLRSEFEGLRNVGDRYDVSAALNGHIVKDVHGKPVFSLENLENRSITGYDSFAVILWILGTLCLFFYIHSVAGAIVRQRGLKKGVAALLIFIIAYRLITIYIPFPFDYKKLELFDASIYASSFLLPSLGDLLLNSVLIFWLVAFVKAYLLPVQALRFKATQQNSYLINGIIALIFIFTAFFLGDIVKSLVAESQISFDVTDFFSLNIYTIVGFIVLTILMLGFYHATHILLHLSRLLPAIELHYRLIGTAVLGLIILLFSPFNTENSVNVLILLWLLLYLFIQSKRSMDWGLPILRSSLFIFWLMFFAASVTALLVYQNQQTERIKRRSTAEKLALQTDPSGENLISITITSLDDQWLATQFHRFDMEHANRFLKDSLITENFAGYLNKFDTKIYTYDSLFHPLHNDDSTTTYAVIKSLMQTRGKPTQTAGLYYYENSDERFSYLYEKHIRTSNGRSLGYLFIVAKPKRYKSEALYPELFNQVSDISPDLNSNYSYAVYNNGKLINSYNDQQFSMELPASRVPALEEVWKTNNGRSELWYKPSPGKVVIVVKNDVLFLESVTLFAYFFFSLLFAILLVHAARYLVNANFRVKQIWSKAALSIRNQIHLTIIFISLFSFVIIGVATISFFVIRFNRSNTERLGRTIQVMRNEIETKINTIRVSDDNVSIYDLGLTSELEKTLAEVSDIHNVDVNFYDDHGALRLSTIPYIYNKGILNRRMEPEAFYQMATGKRVEWLQKETVGGFSYLSIYVPIKDENQHTFAYLNIPYLNSQRELNEEISNFLVTLINLNAFIFLLAGAIAFFLANKITSSFSLISTKMREVNLGTVNEEIHWKNRDEIGALVDEYNKMVKKLEASANALARSEREGAWREMARQVAHEIKNPLTPMKLSIQHLQRAIDAGAPNVKELSQRMAATLIEQIDQLALIAADFSQFANIGNIKPEVVDLQQVLQSLAGLYSADDTLTLHFRSSASTTTVFADKTQVNRLFTNLIKNAIEASEGKQHIEVYLALQPGADNTIIVSVTDEGTGIPFSMQQKIFSPNFTTKTSGTGLGLAICKAIVEKANGSIWFETTEGKGTTFFVQFPLHQESL